MRDEREFAWINALVMIALVIGISFISVMVTKCVYSPKPEEVDRVVRDAEYHRLRIKHCGPSTWCFVEDYPGPKATFVDANGRKGRFK